MLAEAVPGYRRDLGGGLTLRWSNPRDTESIAHLVGRAFRRSVEDPPNSVLADGIRLLMRGDHPLMGPGDFAVVEDRGRPEDPIVACTCLWRHRWLYEAVSLPVGRPEMVASDPAYRNRGLVRELFAMVHARSQAEGHVVQAITGIPYFYRQFGYEYALDLDGERRIHVSSLARAAGEAPETLRLREATAEDVPMIQRLYRGGRRQSMVWADWPDHLWEYYIEGWRVDPELPRRGRVHVIVDGEGRSCGLACLVGRRDDRALGVWTLEVAEHVSWSQAMPALLRALVAAGQEMPVAADTEPLGEITLRLGATHPAYDVLGREMAPYERRPYAWYVRVPDLAELITRIAPVLEARLAAAPSAAGFSGALELDFFGGGLRMVFEHGNLAAAEPWRPPPYGADFSAGFPPLVFLKLLFGHRSLDELRHAFPDVRASAGAEHLLDTLFPTRPSFVLPG
jgi:hypothetical protein